MVPLNLQRFSLRGAMWTSLIISPPPFQGGMPCAALVPFLCSYSVLPRGGFPSFGGYDIGIHTPFSSLLFELETCRTAWFWEQRNCIWYAYDHIMDVLDIFRYVTWCVLDIVGICWMCPLNVVWTHLQDLGLAPEETHAGWAIHLVTWVFTEKWIEMEHANKNWTKIELPSWEDLGSQE
jgi:hypothetical protein